MLLAFGAAVALSQNGSGATARFRIAEQGYRLQFPLDHGAHPGFATEWWYFTGNLGGGGRRFGFELTFFRISPSPVAPLQDDLFLAHFALSDLDRHTFVYHERARRGTWQQAGVRSPETRNQKPETIEVWNENWRVQIDGAGPEHLTAQWGNNAVELTLHASGAPMLNGRAGWSQKGDQPGEASYYYSYPRLQANGRVRANGEPTAVRGEVWMDHEFGSSQLAPQQQGWDWMGLQLEDEATGIPFALMAFNLRDKNGVRDPHSAGTLRMGPSDEPLFVRDFSMLPRDTWLSPHTNARYPIVWRLDLPSRRLALEVRAAIDDQELLASISGVEYWEGAVDVSGEMAGHSVRGRGYLEMTGYAHPFELLKSEATAATAPSR
jgi:predicted secreted hydrolase